MEIGFVCYFLEVCQSKLDLYHEHSELCWNAFLSENLASVDLRAFCVPVHRESLHVGMCWYKVALLRRTRFRTFVDEISISQLNSIAAEL